MLVPALFYLFGQGVGHFGNDEAGSNGVGTDAARSHLFSDGLRKSDHTGFRSRIVALSGIAADTHHGRHIDNRTAALARHDRRNGVNEVESRFQIDVQHGVPLRFAHAHHQAVFGDAGIIDQNVDAAEILHDLVDHFVRIFKVGGVRSVSFGFYAQGVQLLLRLLAVFVDRQIGERDVGSLFCKLNGDRFADAPGCAGYDGHFSFE